MEKEKDSMTTGNTEDKNTTVPNVSNDDTNKYAEGSIAEPEAILRVGPAYDVTDEYNMWVEDHELAESAAGTNDVVRRAANTVSVLFATVSASQLFVHTSPLSRIIIGTGFAVAAMVAYANSPVKYQPNDKWIEVQDYVRYEFFPVQRTVLGRHATIGEIITGSITAGRMLEIIRETLPSEWFLNSSLLEGLRHIIEDHYGKDKLITGNVYVPLTTMLRKEADINAVAGKQYYTDNLETLSILEPYVNAISKELRR